MNIYGHVTIAIIFVYVSIFCQGKRISVNRIYDVHVCKMPPEPAFMRIHDINLYNRMKNNTFLNAKFEVMENIENFQIRIDVHRCISQEVLDSCEKLTNLNPTHPCTFIKLKGMLWSKLIESIEPSISCPIKKGNYTVTNVSFDTNLFKLFQLDGFFWKIVLYVSNGKDTIGICADFQVFTVNV